MSFSTYKVGANYVGWNHCTSKIRLFNKSWRCSDLLRFFEVEVGPPYMNSSWFETRYPPPNGHASREVPRSVFGLFIGRRHLQVGTCNIPRVNFGKWHDNYVSHGEIVNVQSSQLRWHVSVMAAYCTPPPPPNKTKLQYEVVIHVNKETSIGIVSLRLWLPIHVCARCCRLYI